MKLLIFSFISLFFTYCFAALQGSSFCSGGVFYRWDTKGGCACRPGWCSPMSNQFELLTANTASEAGENCYKQFNNNEVCRKKCIETFTQDCEGRKYRRTLYKESNGDNNKFCRDKIGYSHDCL